MKVVKLDDILSLLEGIDRTDEGADDNGWWETDTGAEFGASVLKALQDKAIEVQNA